MKAGRVVERISFDPQGSIPPGVLDGRTSNRPWIVADETLPADAPGGEHGEDPDALTIAWIIGGTTNERVAIGRSESFGPAADLSVHYESEGVVVDWTSGRAVVQSFTDCKAELLAALADFDFLERRLRRLENALAECEESTEEDIGRAYAIRFRDRSHWRRMKEKIEACTRLRFAFVRLRLPLEKGAPGLPPEGKRLAAALRRRAQIAYRLDGFCERLEACEDLYEGAHDRIGDHRWYLGGHFLEITIIVLLATEGLFMWLKLHSR